MALITAVKGLKVQTPGACPVKHYPLVIYGKLIDFVVSS
jgi:hypothetical protein